MSTHVYEATLSSPGRNLEPFLNPKSIAVVGVSRNPSAVGSICLQALKRAYKGDLFAVNPSGQTSLYGVPAFGKVEEVPANLDLVIVAVPMERAESVVAECADAGAKSVMLFTAGFAESGSEGADAQSRIRSIAQDHGMILSGPNTMGYVNTIDDVLATFYITSDDPTPPQGTVALVSQSGGFGVHLSGAAREAGVELGSFVTTGNEADVHVSEVLGYLVDRDEASLFLVFCESIKDGELLRRTSWKASKNGKPIVLLKVGVSEAGERASLSHTASISGSDAVLEAACRQFGVLRVKSMAEMVDTAALATGARKMKGKRVGIVTGSGGGGILAADACHAAGLTVPEFSAGFAAELAAGLPTFASVGNPVDITAQAISMGGGVYEDTLRKLVAYDECDAILVLSGMVGPSAVDVAHSIRNIFLTTNKPVAVAWMSGHAGATKILEDGGVPFFRTPERAAAALGNVALFPDLANLADADADVKCDSLDEELDRSIGGFLLGIRQNDSFDGVLDEVASKELLRLAGFSVPQERQGDEQAIKDCHAGMAKPMVLKILSSDIPHKSDVGGVALNIVSEQDLSDAVQEMAARVEREAPEARIDGYVLQEQIATGTEILIGLHHDHTFGQVVTVALGGKLVEVIDESKSLVVPFSHDQAKRSIRELCGGRLVNGKRSLTEIQVDSIADCMVRLGILGRSFPEIVEIEINPVIANETGVYVADGLARIEDR